MSKRHAASRRRSYGRRQHEIAEHRDRNVAPERADVGPDELEFSLLADGIALGDLRGARVHYASGS